MVNYKNLKIGQDIIFRWFDNIIEVRYNVDSIKKFIDEINEYRSPPTLVEYDVRDLRTQTHQHRKIFDEYNSSEKELIKNFLIKQHNNCHNSFRQQLYYEDLRDFGFKVKRKVVDKDVCGGELCRIVRVYD